MGSKAGVGAGALILLAVFSVGLSRGDQPESARPKVLVLGSYHMTGGRDLENPQVDNVLSPERQRQLGKFIQTLKKFRPTKIALEVTQNHEAEIQRQYEAYLAGTFELKPAEIYQVGFRLAKQMGHRRLYAIDHPAPFDFDKVAEFAKRNGQDRAVAASRELAATFAKEIGDVIATRTVTEIFRFLNSPESIRQQDSFYATLLSVGKGEDYPGPGLVATWYRRNMIIFSNLTRVIDSPQDRVLVLIGQGHAPYLQRFVDFSLDYDLVRLQDYLD